MVMEETKVGVRSEAPRSMLIIVGAAPELIF